MRNHSNAFSVVLPPPRRFLAVDKKTFAKKKKKEKSDQTAKRALIFDLKLQDEKMVNLLINIVLFCFLVFPGEQEADVERETRATGKVPRRACLVLHVLFVLD